MSESSFSIACKETISPMNLNEDQPSADAPSVNFIDSIKSEDVEATTGGNIEIKEKPLETMGEDLDASTDDIEIKEEALETTDENLDASPGDDIEIKEEPLETTVENPDARTGDDIEIKEEPLETTGECDSQLKIVGSKSLKADSSNEEVCSIAVMSCIDRQDNIYIRHPFLLCYFQ